MPSPTAPTRVAGVLGLTDPHRPLIDAPLTTWLVPGTPLLAPHTPVAEAARQMRAAGVDAALVVEQGYLFGLVTDADLRDRVLAEGLSPQTPVGDAATLAPQVIGAGRSAFEALLQMTRLGVRHLPVVDGEGRALGLLQATRLENHHERSALRLAAELRRSERIEAMAAICAEVPRLHRQLVAASASAYASGQLITSVTDALTTRLLELAERQLGPAPVDYAWVVAGSQGRCEQTSRSDQDNCLILDDDGDAERHGAYFKALADFVADGLHACGYVYCPGEMMAKNPEWRRTLSSWRVLFRQWVEEPIPKALMYTSVYFDVRVVHGDSRLLDTLRAEVRERAMGNGLFLGHMVGNALSARPALGCFGRLAPTRTGAERGSIDLKRRGLIPIVDLARVYALKGGHVAVNTVERLRAALQAGELGADEAHNLIEAFEFIGALRLAHQARQIDAGLPTDNRVAVATLSGFEGAQLREAMTVIARLQQLLRQRHLQ
ncbi:MAG: DUF294 nucleotidyltransferase-like domain-containing protein [Xanthomonadales bacterium]|jgi:CBS domain-containing protein|nr:DUF294 nucleotidyltransferase-like domain-containing protein [Xanthomonadales bacterium]